MVDTSLWLDITTRWFLIAGALLLFMGASNAVFRRLPVSTAMFYLLVGYALGPGGAALLDFDPLKNAPMLERVTEIALLISLFAVGLKLRPRRVDQGWRMWLRLGGPAMLITIGLLAAAGIFVFGLSPGAALLLGAILAPTDPVLASDVQVKNAADRDLLRSSLTGEAGLNDGTVYPFAMLAIGLLGLHDLGSFGARWLAIDLFWAVGAGLGSGWAMGRLVSSAVVRLRQKYPEAVGLEEFLTLGLIALTYGVALLIHGNGFLAVFAAGLAVRRLEHQTSGGGPPPDLHQPLSSGSKSAEATHPDTAPAYMAESVLRFNLQLERLTEMIVVLLVGSMVTVDMFSAWVWLLIGLLFFLIRPAAVLVVTTGARVSSTRRMLLAWFGIRGIGSIYYLMFAIQSGLPPDLARRLVPLVFGVVTASIIVHGISATPLMERYGKRPRGTPRG